VTPGDSNGFARELERFRAMPPSERSAIGARCRELAHSRFSLPRMLAEYDEIYGEVA
jgi:glycosyltransferase involved in cell wall biosynthesis